MRKLVIFLSMTTALFAASTVYLLTGRLDPPTAPAVGGAPAPLTPAPPPTASLPAPVAAVPTSAMPSTAASSPRLGDLDLRFLADAADPSRRLDLIAATKANLEAEYQRLAQ